MDEHELEIAQKRIQYCPLCGHQSKKPFDNVHEYGGDWICENCDERVEAYLLERDDTGFEEEEEKRVSNSSFSKGILQALLLFIIIAVIYFLF